jgi:cyclic dehypoxanthinyl futalosine synthase
MIPLELAIHKARSLNRLDAADALILLQEADLLTLAELANFRRMSAHPESVVTYVVDRNINYTNVCISECLFCAYYRRPTDKEAFIITEAELRNKIEETLNLGGTQILLQGGMHPDLPLSYYQNLLGFIKKNFNIHIHGFSPTEVVHIANKNAISINNALKALIAAGLDSIPGGGAEILDDDVRKKISPKKCTAVQWLEAMRQAHRLGLKTTATMMFGHVETPEQLISHLIKIRDLQEETGGFTAFIPWTFQPDNTRIHVRTATAVTYLRVLAVSRLVIDNIPNIQASWVTQGDKIAQLALSFGANDMGSTMIEENVVAAAGVRFRLPKEEMLRLIRDAGYRPIQRDCFYRPVALETESA